MKLVCRLTLPLFYLSLALLYLSFTSPFLSLYPFPLSASYYVYGHIVFEHCLAANVLCAHCQLY